MYRVLRGGGGTVAKVPKPGLGQQALIRKGNRCRKNRVARNAETWGAAMDVPVKDAYPLPGTAERTPVPGAETSGLISQEPVPPQVVGPWLELPARGKLGTLPLTFPTQKEFTKSVLMTFGAVMELGPWAPSLPAEKTTAMPTASAALRAETHAPLQKEAVLPVVNPQELLIPSGMSPVVVGSPSGSRAH